MEVYPVVDAGVDYLTVTGAAASNASLLDHFGTEVLYAAKEAGQRIRPASRLGFRGLRSEHIFTGVNDHGSIVVVSGAECVPLAGELIMRSDNVTRIDLQVTVSLSQPDPLLAHELYRRARAHYVQHKTRRGLRLQMCYPSGATLNVAKRISDWSGRVYDKSIEARLGPAGAFWRYEAELKRLAAMRAAAELIRTENPRTHVTSRVWSMFNDRHVYPAFSAAPSDQADHPLFPHVPSNSLRWFEDMVRYSVTKAVRRHGLDQVLRSLGLANVVQPKQSNKRDT